MITVSSLSDVVDHCAMCMSSVNQKVDHCIIRGPVKTTNDPIGGTVEKNGPVEILIGLLFMTRLIWCQTSEGEGETDDI